MKVIRTFVKIIFSIALLAVLTVFVLSIMHEDLSQFDGKFVESEPADVGDVSVQFMGNSNLLFSDGETSLLIDGWFSRPDLRSLAFGTIEPDLEAITRAFERGQIGELAAVIPVHSHFDHAMDSPEVARRTGASLLGSMSTVNIAKGWGLDESQIELVQPNRKYSYGDFKVTLIPSEHFEFENSGMREAALGDIEITQPLKPPVNVKEYKMGGAYSVYIQHPNGSVLVQASAGFVANALDDLNADIVFLGIGGLSSKSDQYRQAYWQHAVRAVSPNQIFPIHWDSLTDPLESVPVTPNLLISKGLNSSSIASLNLVFDYAAKDKLDIGLLPMWQTIRLF